MHEAKNRIIYGVVPFDGGDCCELEAERMDFRCCKAGSEEERKGNRNCGRSGAWEILVASK